jgi:hypothetical protein
MFSVRYEMAMHIHNENRNLIRMSCMYCTAEQLYVSKDSYLLDVMYMRSSLLWGVRQR